MGTLEQYLKYQFFQQKADAPKQQLPTIPAKPTEAPKAFKPTGTVIRGQSVTIYRSAKNIVRYDKDVLSAFRQKAYKYFNVTAEEIRQANRHNEIVEIRRMIYVAFVEFTSIKTVDYSGILGQDRATVYHAINAHKDMISIKGNGDYIRRFNEWMQAMQSYIQHHRPQFRMVRK